MSSGNDGEWVRQGTPRDAEWDDEQSEYGTAVSPAEWDDHTPEQSVQVTPPSVRPRIEEGEEVEAEPTTRVVLSDPAAQEATPLKPMPAPQAEAPVAPSRAAGDVQSAPSPSESGVPPRPVAPARPALHRSPAASPTVDAEPTVGRRMPEAPVVAPSPARPEPEVIAASAEAEADEPTAKVELEPEDPITSTQEVPLFQEAPEAEAVPTPAAQPEVEDELTEVVPVAEERVRPRPVVTPTEEPAAAVPDGVFRDGGEEPTEVIAEPVPEPTVVVPTEELDEERRRQELIAAERAARNERLGVVETSGLDEVRVPQAAPKRVTDKFLPSLGLLFLRLVVAAILGVIGYQMLTSPEATAERLATTALPQPELMTWVLGFTFGGIALCLVIGMMVRVAGLLMLAASVASLALYRWGAFSPFVPGVEGFSGDRDLLLGAVGMLFIAVGGGGWGIDGAFRRARARARAERTS
ncbi:MAG: DoxX family membrane protein [Propionibacteriaceae bacterium]|nr:DoxX family membrane protein [Propionibacteriaceae bacterium]